MILSRKDIENIATSLFLNISASESEFEITPLEDIAVKHLKLSITYLKLSDKGNVLGLTTYADTKCKICTDGEDKIIELSCRQILLDDMFIHPEKKEKLFGKHRFTLAHEIAHQLLFGMEMTEDRARYEKIYSTRTHHSVKELKTKEDWNEWQANTLGAAILMPINKVILMMKHITGSKKLTNYGGFLKTGEKEALKCFCEHFGVSKTAALIRLRQLGYIEDKLFSDYVDPLGVYYEE